jgi:hypothetical protein
MYIVSKYISGKVCLIVLNLLVVVVVVVVIFLFLFSNFQISRQNVWITSGGPGGGRLIHLEDLLEDVGSTWRTS